MMYDVILVFIFLFQQQNIMQSTHHLLFEESCDKIKKIQKIQKNKMSTYFYILIGITLCYLYVIMAQYFSFKKFNYIQETSVAIILGTLFGVAIYFLEPDLFVSENSGAVFREVVFLILLPPMLFEDGYNIKKRKFFQNTMYISIYGIVGTIFNFFTISALLYAFSINGLITSVFDDIVIQFKIWQIFAFAACMCSIDTVVPEKIINPERYSKLFSIVFGESIMKDTIAVTLFDSIVRVYQQLDKEQDIGLDAEAAGFLVLFFFIVVLSSILIGIICALMTTVIFKHWRFLLHEKGVSEIALIMLTGYAGYVISEWCEFSGVISMLFCGITLSHFNVYNLTEEGKCTVKIAITTLALVAEGVLFFVVGAFIFNVQTEDSEDQKKFSFSWVMIAVGIGSVLIARVVNVFLMSLLGYLIIGKKKWKLNFYQYQIIFVSGLVKGAVPFALILTMPNIQISTSCIQTTTFFIVYVSSLFLNAIMPKILRNRLKKILQLRRKNPDHPSLFESFLDHDPANSQKNRQLSKPLSESVIRENIALQRRIKSTTQKYWRKCEEGCLKPHLIFDYHNRKEQIKQQKKKQRIQQYEQNWRYYKETLNALYGTNSVELQKSLDMRYMQIDESVSEEESSSSPSEDKSRSKSVVLGEVELVQQQEAHNRVRSLPMEIGNSKKQ